MVAKGEKGWGEMEREAGVSRCKLLYIEWVNNNMEKIDNYIQYPRINQNGKENKNCMCVCIHTHTHTHITESFCCTAKINTTL